MIAALYIFFLVITYIASIVFVWDWSVNANHWRWDEKGYESPWHIVIALGVPSIVYLTFIYFMHLA